MHDDAVSLSIEDIMKATRGGSHERAKLRPCVEHHFLAGCAAAIASPSRAMGCHDRRLAFAAVGERCCRPRGRLSELCGLPAVPGEGVLVPMSPSAKPTQSETAASPATCASGKGTS